jgi:hypothetical protein
VRSKAEKDKYERLQLEALATRRACDESMNQLRAELASSNQKVACLPRGNLWSLMLIPSQLEAFQQEMKEMRKKLKAADQKVRTHLRSALCVSRSLLG